MPTDYEKYRGKCQEMCASAIENDPTLTLVRGFYHCPLWGKQAHWWTTKTDGSIFDPSVKQFPTKGVAAEYEVFDGYAECEQCGERVHEDDAIILGNGHYAICSDMCARRFVGI